MIVNTDKLRKAINKHYNRLNKNSSTPGAKEAANRLRQQNLKVVDDAEYLVDFLNNPQD